MLISQAGNWEFNNGSQKYFILSRKKNQTKFAKIFSIDVCHVEYIKIPMMIWRGFSFSFLSLPKLNLLRKYLPGGFLI